MGVFLQGSHLSTPLRGLFVVRLLRHYFGKGAVKVVCIIGGYFENVAAGKVFDGIACDGIALYQYVVIGRYRR